MRMPILDQGLLALQIIGSTLAGIGFYFRQKVGKLFVRCGLIRAKRSLPRIQSLPTIQTASKSE